MIKKVSFFLIVLLAIFLRFYKLGSLPNSFTPDEVAQGYTAYSILQTGKDEWGSSNLLSFRSFGDFKPPVQTLLMIPSIKVFGLTPFAVRFPNAILSVFSVILFYFLIQKIFNDSKLSFLGSLLLSVSPLFLPMSRIALEANLLLFFIILGLFLFFLFLENKKTLFLVLSSLFLSLSLFVYHSAKLFIPFLFLVLCCFFWRLLKRKNILVFLSIFFAFVFLNQYSTSQIKVKRTSDIAVFNPTDKWASVSDSRYEAVVNGLPSSVSRIFNNKLIYSSNIFIGNYFSYFSPQFLISGGAGETTYGMIPGVGILGLVPTFGLVFGLYFLLTHPKNNKNIWFLFLCLVFSPVAASLAKGNFSANRASVMIPFLLIISSFGLIRFFEIIKKKIFYKLFLFVFSLIFIFNIFSFLEKYFFEGNQVLAEGMLYGRKEAIEYLNSLKRKPEAIVFSRKLSEPQSYAMFFDKVDPKTAQKDSTDWLRYESSNLSFLDQLGDYSLSNFIFRELNIVSDIKLKNTLIIGKPDEFRDTKPQKIIYYPFATKQVPVIYIYQTE